MQAERLGAMHGTRISFARSLIRRMARDHWNVTEDRFDLDRDGYGVCVYCIEAYGETYSLVIFSDHIEDHERTDRVIAQKWDITCVLRESGIVDTPTLERLRANVPKQEAGRFDAEDIVLCRANKSVRNFAYVVDCLAAGKQPDVAAFTRVGYLVRTTAVYGNGKFGIADYPKLTERRAFAPCFSAQMCVVYLMRHFSIRLAEHLAAKRAPGRAVRLDPRLQRYVGVGNATGLGMAPFLIRHPHLIDAWFRARETALARVLAIEAPDESDIERGLQLLERAQRHLAETVINHDLQRSLNERTLAELPIVRDTLLQWRQASSACRSWQALFDQVIRKASMQTQEIVSSVLIELYPKLVDELENGVGTAEVLQLDPVMQVGQLREMLEQKYAWALQYDWNASDADHYFWYRSAEKEEPRLGVRREEPGQEKEMPLGIARSVTQLHQTLGGQGDSNRSVAEFLLFHPECRAITRRVQSMANYEYGEIHDNLLGRESRPINLLRGKLAMLGAGKFDPKSNLWVRVTFFQGAPTLHELKGLTDDDWAFPCAPIVDGTESKP